MKYEPDIDIPVEEFCTLRQAAEFLAFGYQPVLPVYDEWLGYKHYRREDTQPASYFNDMDHAEKTLAVLITRSDITLTGIADPAFPVHRYEEYGYMEQEEANEIHKAKGYNPKTFNERTTVKLPERWTLDIDENWIVNKRKGETSYREIRIPFAEMDAVVKRVQPKHHYTVHLNDDGELLVTDGTITCTIANLRPNNKKYKWLKFYFDHPNQKITKEMMTVAFKDTDFEFQDGDRMTGAVHTTFDGNTGIMHACFPVLSDKEIVCRPDFTDLDIQH